MKFSTKFAFAAAMTGLLAIPLVAAEKTDCLTLAITVSNQVKADPGKTLEIVEAQVAANPECACEVVKAAIQANQADPSLVARIVEVAATVAPDKMRIIAQCAVAVAPDSLGGVQAVLAKLDPNRGEGGAKGAKGGKGGLEKAGIVEPAAVPNPLDFPGGGIGPTPGGPGGFPLFPPPFPVPPVIVPPVTDPGAVGPPPVVPPPHES